jgi:ribA/ribD-fused uncharacterized protein
MRKVSTIEFDDKTKKYQCFLNTYPKDIDLDDKSYASVANYYYSKMYENIDVGFAEQLRCSDVGELKELAEKRKKEVKDEWYSNRLNVLYNAIKQKFEKNEDLLKILLSTDHHYLEYCNRDSFLGNGKGGNGGCNVLGKLLMEVRSALKR